MPDVTRCPTRDDLRRFLLGEVDDEEAARVQGHLSTCCGCLESLPRLETNDVLLLALQAQGRLAEDSDEAVVADLMDRLSGLHRPDAGSSPQQSPRAFRELLQRFVTVCQTIAYAHSKGVIHRDLKPANVMLGEYGETLVVDWGLAKQVGSRAEREEQLPHDDTTFVLQGQTISASDAGLTAAGQVLGTPSYMSPEQAAGHSAAVGPATDIYALGAILYEFLAGEAPYADAVGFLEIFSRLSSAVPPRAPSQVQANVPRALEAVCRKAMAHSPAERYATSQELAGDIDKWLADEPVPCYREPWPARLARWSRRHRTWVRAGAVALLLIAVVSTVAALLVNQEKEEKARLAVEATDAARIAKARGIESEERRQQAEFEWDRAENQLSRAEWLLYVNQIASAQREWQAGNARAAWEQLDACRRDLRGWEHDYLFTLFNKNHRTLKGHTYYVASVAFSPDGTRIVSGSGDDTLRIWDVATGQQTHKLRGHTDRITSVAFGPDGTWIVSASYDHTLRLWDAVTGQTTHTLQGHTAHVNALAVSPDGKQIASGSDDQTLKLWNAVTGQEVRTIPGHSAGVWGLAFSPVGTRIASGSADGTLKLWDAVTGQELRTFRGQGGNVQCLAFSPDGKRIVSGHYGSNTLKLWDAATDPGARAAADLLDLAPDRWRRFVDVPLRILKGHSSPVSGVAFSPDGKQIVSGSADNTLKLWDAATGQETRTLNGHTWHVNCVAFSPDGRRIASGSWDTTLKIWDLMGDREALAFDGHTASITSVAFSPDGKRIVSGAAGRTPNLWDAGTGKDLFPGIVTKDLFARVVGSAALKGHTGQVLSVAFSPDGKRFVTGCRDTTLRVWDAATGQSALTLDKHKDWVTSVAFSPDGKWIVSGSYDKTLKLWDATNGQETRTLEGHTELVASVAFSPDGKQIVSGSQDCTVRLWDATTGLVTHAFKVRDYLACVAFSPDGKQVVSGSWDASLRFWDAVAGQELRTLTGHTARVNSVAFSPDGKRLVSASEDLTLKLWDVATGRETLTLTTPVSVNCVAFSPDGMRIVSGGAERMLRVWDATIRE